MIRIGLIDDHPVVRAGLKRLLSVPPCTVVGETGTLEEAHELLRTTPCDLLVVDVRVGNADGLSFVRALRAERHVIPILVHSMYPEADYGVAALQAGAQGYITKLADEATWQHAVVTVARGSRYVSADLAEQLAIAQVRRGLRHERLSARELEVLQAIAQGETVTQIGQRLSLSVKTVATYRARLIEKLGVTTTSDMIRYALRYGLTDPNVRTMRQAKARQRSSPTVPKISG
jgi:two-component system, NarL family, invasion response regulator UvrY